MTKQQQSYLAGSIILAVSAWLSSKFFAFTADDSYILLRYAENFVHHGELSFNLGERINALTSPLHGTITIILSFLTGKYLLYAGKIFMAILLLATVFIISHRHTSKPLVFILPLLVFLLSPFVLMWTFGGLETILLLFIITLLSSVSLKPASTQNFYAMCLIAGFAFVARFDSVIFTAPFLFSYFVLRYRQFFQLKTIFFACLFYGIIPLLWLSFSLYYYKDIFPTSFYLKISKKLSIYTITYCFQFFMFTGAIAYYMFGLIGLTVQKQKNAIISHYRQFAHLYIGLFFITLYAFANANAHMMFGYRMQLPYFGAVIVIILNLLSKQRIHTKAFFLQPVYAMLLLSFTTLQIIQLQYVYSYSLNGFSITGEFREMGIKSWNKYIKTLELNAEDIKKHASQQIKFKYKEPSLSTAAEGVIPYKYMCLYVYGDLVSRRIINGRLSHTFTEHKYYTYGLNSDYLHVGLPYQTHLYSEMSNQPSRFELISQRNTFTTGTISTSCVFYNKNPQPITLPKYVRNLPREIFSIGHN